MATFSAFWALAHVARGAMAHPGPPWIRQCFHCKVSFCFFFNFDLLVTRTNQTSEPIFTIYMP